MSATTSAPCGPAGIFAAVDFDIGAARCDPPIPLLTTLVCWMLAAFRAAHADPTIGTRLAPLLIEAGVTGVTGFGVQGYLAADDPSEPAMVAGVIAALAPQMVASGIASEAELDLQTLEGRIAEAVRATGAAIVPPTVVGAFGRRGDG